MKEMDVESGSLGRFFGTEKNAPLNIAGLVLVILLVPGVLLLFFKANIEAIEYWKIIIPVITAILGYAFGRR
jgi:hypothetical protein